MISVKILKCLACGWQFKLEGAPGSLCRVNWGVWSHLPVALGNKGVGGGTDETAEACGVEVVCLRVPQLGDDRLEHESALLSAHTHTHTHTPSVAVPALIPLSRESWQVVGATVALWGGKKASFEYGHVFFFVFDGHTKVIPVQAQVYRGVCVLCPVSRKLLAGKVTAFHWLRVGAALCRLSLGGVCFQIDSSAEGMCAHS